MTRTPDRKPARPASGKPASEETLEAAAADRPPAPGSKDRPGFDLGGAVTDATAGSGLGLGEDAAENRRDQRLPGRRQRARSGPPRFGGAVVRDK